ALGVKRGTILKFRGNKFYGERWTRWRMPTGWRSLEASRNKGLGQIIIHPVVARVHIDPTGGRRFLKFVVVVFERIERLNLLIGRQLLPVPAPAKRADERDRGSQ